MDITKIVQMHKTLGDKTRCEIFISIWKHPNITGKELLVEFHISQPTLSFHLSKLENGELIRVKKVGQSHHYSPNIELLKEMVDFGQEALKTIKKSR